MLPTRLRLKPGADPKLAVRGLSERIMMGNNVTSHGVGPGGPETTNALRNAYLEWAEATEVQLQGLTFDAGVIGALHTARYWRIRMLHEDPRPFALVDAEVRQQVAWLQALLDDLNDRIARAGGRGHLTVLDSNVVLHFLPLDQIRWTEVINRSPVRLVLPLRVIEELDSKKYARRDELAERARNILPRIEAVVGSDGRPGLLSADVTVEVPVQPGTRYRPVDADEEILDTCREFQQLTSQPVSLVTGDTAMRLRARAHGVPVIRMPDTYSRRARQAT